MSTLHAWLEFTDVQTGSPRRVDIDHNTLSIGRTSGDLQLTDLELSGLHAIVSREMENFVIRDLGSSGGTFLNDRPVVEARLTNLDRIRVGKTVLTFNAAYLEPEVFARRHGLLPTADEDPTGAPGHAVAGEAHHSIIPFAMLSHPLRFWPRALEAGVFELRRTWLTHALILLALVAGALLANDGVPFLHLGFLTFTAALALALVAVTCSVFFAFDSLPDAPHRLSQSLRFTFHVAPFVLTAQVLFLTWAERIHPRGDKFFLVSLIPTLIFWAAFALQSRHAFGAGLARGIAFALTASVPWNLLMTGLMSFVI